MKQVSSTTVAAVALNKPAANGAGDAVRTRVGIAVQKQDAHSHSSALLRSISRARAVHQRYEEDEWRALNSLEVRSALAWRDTKHGDTTEEWSSTPIGLPCRTNISFDEKVVRDFERRVGYFISTPCEETRHMLISLGF